MDDRLHGQALLRDLAIINARSARELGPLPAGGLPVEVKRKPILPKPAAPPTSTNAPPPNEEIDMDWTRITAAATLTAAASLSACAADQSTHTATTPPPQTQSESVTAAVEAAPALTSSIDEQDAEPERGVPIPAAELRRRILALIGSFESLKDLEREHVESMMQVNLIKRPTMDDGYQAFGKTIEGWNYRVAVARLSRLDEPPTIQIYLNNGVEPWTDQEATYCTLVFEPLANEMVAMGYERAEDSARLNGNTTWWFEKPVSPEGTSVAVGASLYSLASDNGKPLTCIRSLRIGGNTRHG